MFYAILDARDCEKCCNRAPCIRIGVMDLGYLRRATRAEHEGTEATVPLMKPELTRAEYVETLQRMYRAVSAWDAWSTQHVPQRLVSLLQGRQRSPLLAQDLTTLGAITPQDSASAQLPAGATEAEFLGRMYVMEGSTLGGQYIARHVEETLGLAPGVGDAYFRGYGERTSAMWKAFQSVLAELPEEQTETVVQAAKQMFGFFGGCMSPKVALGA